MRIDPKTMLALFGALVFAGCGPVYVRSRGTVRAQATVRVAVMARFHAVLFSIRCLASDRNKPGSSA